MNPSDSGSGGQLPSDEEAVTAPLVLLDSADTTFIEFHFASQPVSTLHAATNTGAGQVVTPPACGFQAVCPVPFDQYRIDPISPLADSQRPAPVTLQQQAAVRPDAFSYIAQRFEKASRKHHTTNSCTGLLSTQLPPSRNVSYLPGPVAAENRHLDPASSTAGCSPQQLSTNPLNFVPQQTLALPDTVPCPASPQTTHLFAPWPPVNPSLNETSLGNPPIASSHSRHITYPGSFNTVTNDSILSQSPNEGGIGPWPSTYYPALLNYQAPGAVDFQIEKAGLAVTANVPAPRTSTISRPTKFRAPQASNHQPQDSSPLPIVQYKPLSNTDTRSPKKRPAPEELPPQGMASRAIRAVQVLDNRGELHATMMTFGQPIKARSIVSEEQRQKTAIARREGVCSRCKNSKRQCDLALVESPYDSCTRCITQKIYKNAPRNPCFKTTLADILLFRSGPARNEPFFSERFGKSYDLADLSKPGVPPRRLTLTQHIGCHKLTVYASEFVPSQGDVVSYKWRNSGKLHELRMPDFCLTNMKEVYYHFRQYIDSAKWAYLESLETEDELAWMTVSTAMQYARRNPNSLVADCLHLWAIARMIEIPWEMCGLDTLGVSPVTDPTSPHKGRIPIPPIMDTQLDQVVIRSVLMPLREKVIQKFESLITPVKREAWWEVYLSSFIILNHIERLARHSVVHARTHTMRSKYSSIPFLEAAFHTAKCILARFHFICNGSAPLRLDWKSPKVASMAKLDSAQVAFMQRTQALIASKEADVQSLKTTHKYEENLYWTGQLFTEDFDKSPVHIEDVPVDEEIEGREETQVAIKSEEG